MTSKKIQRCSHIINYYLTCKYQAKGIIKFMYMNVSENLDDIVTKSFTSNKWFPLMNNLLFWRDMDFLKYQVVSEGNENSPSAPHSLLIAGHS